MDRQSTIWRTNVFNSVQPTDIVVDLGACIGKVSEIFAKKATEGLVVAVEPVYENYKVLLQRVIKYGLKNVIPIFGGISNKTGLSKIILCEYEEAHSSWPTIYTEENSLGERSMVVFTWDALVDMLNIEKVDFLKVDVNGAEVELLEGMTKILPKRILLEDSSKLAPMSTLFRNEQFNERLLLLLTEKGYKIRASIKYWYLLEL